MVNILHRIFAQLVLEERLMVDKSFYILSIDTLSNISTLAIIKRDAIFCMSGSETYSHSDHLMCMIEKLIQASSTAFSHLHQICALSGPGGFTGTRVGLATGHGISIASKVPIRGVKTSALTNFLSQSKESLVKEIAANYSVYEVDNDLVKLKSNFKTRVWQANQTQAIHLDLDKLSHINAITSALYTLFLLRSGTELDKAMPCYE